MTFTVAIDGPAAAGKGTLGRAIAERFGLSHLDTGLLYRATGRRVLAGEDAVAAARDLQPADLARGDLRAPEVALAASKASAIEEVRSALLEFQRAYADRMGGAVLDGRDIGTVVCPDAPVKLYCTASDEVRARRRHAELAAAGSTASYAETLHELRVRDRRDSERATAPLRPADDALVLDTTAMSIDEVVDIAARHVAAAMRKDEERG